MVESSNKNEAAAPGEVPASLLKNVYVESKDLTDGEVVKGYDFNQGIDY